MIARTLTICAMSVVSCLAQAWLPPKGDGSVSLTYQSLFFDGHYLTDGTRAPAFQSRANNVVCEINYGITDRIAIAAELPYVFTKYAGKEPPLNPSTVDDRLYHGTFQDFRLELSGNILKRPFVVTPFFAVVIPSHGYEVIGEAAPGRGVNEYSAGVSAGRLLSPILPSAYVHARYAYAFVERVLDIPYNRSNLDLGLGYFVKPSLSLRLLGSLQRTHGGLTVDDVFSGPVDPKIFFNHDRFLRANYQHIGGGITFVVSPSVDVHATVIRFLSGTNTHYGKAVIAGATWTFHTRREPKRHSSNQWLQGFAGLLGRF